MIPVDLASIVINERSDEQVCPLPQAAAHVCEHLVEVGQVDDAGAVDGQARGDQQPEHDLRARHLAAPDDQGDEDDGGQDEEERLHRSGTSGVRAGSPAPAATGAA